MEHMSNIFSASFGINFAKLTRVWLALISLTAKINSLLFLSHPVYVTVQFSRHIQPGCVRKPHHGAAKMCCMRWSGRQTMFSLSEWMVLSQVYSRCCPKSYLLECRHPCVILTLLALTIKHFIGAQPRGQMGPLTPTWCKCPHLPLSYAPAYCFQL